MTIPVTGAETGPGAGTGFPRSRHAPLCRRCPARRAGPSPGRAPGLVAGSCARVVPWITVNSHCRPNDGIWITATLGRPEPAQPPAGSPATWCGGLERGLPGAPLLVEALLRRVLPGPGEWIPGPVHGDGHGGQARGQEQHAEDPEDAPHGCHQRGHPRRERVPVRGVGRSTPSRTPRAIQDALRRPVPTRKRRRQGSWSGSQQG